MPAWWKGKSKSKSTSSPRKKEVEEAAAAVVEEDETPRRGMEEKNEGKTNSFDEILRSGRSRDPSPIYGARGGAAFQPDFAVGLPLPLPSSVSSPLPAGLASASASVSSISSSGSSDETPDLSFHSESGLMCAIKEVKDISDDGNSKECLGQLRQISSYTSIRSFKGSPYWMAPEVIMNSNGYNLSVDIWSLGCTIIEMANGKPPWSQYEGVPAIFKIGNSKDIPELPDHFSHDGKDFLRKCLQRDPSLRPTASQLMDHPFVREQITRRPSMSNTTHETLHAFSDGSHVIMTSMESSSNRSISPLHGRNYVKRSTSPLNDRDYAMRTPEFPLALPSSAYKSKSDLGSIKTNMSLPVSPCSSPLRQFKQSNRSCLPSPPHPAYSAGAANYSPINYALYPTRPSNDLSDPWHDFGQAKFHSPYGSPRRLSMGM